MNHYNNLLNDLWHTSLSHINIINSIIYENDQNKQNSNCREERLKKINNQWLNPQSDMEQKIKNILKHIIDHKDEQSIKTKLNNTDGNIIIPEIKNRKREENPFQKLVNDNKSIDELYDYLKISSKFSHFLDAQQNPYDFELNRVSPKYGPIKINFKRNSFSTYSTAFTELSNGNKSSHWMWYIFPIREDRFNCGSDMCKMFALENEQDVLDYYNHPLLGQRLSDITQVLLDKKDKKINKKGDQTILEILGELDIPKLRCCMTIFFEATKNELFYNVLNKYYEILPPYLFKFDFIYIEKQDNYIIMNINQLINKVENIESVGEKIYEKFKDYTMDQYLRQEYKSTFNNEQGKRWMGIQYYIFNKDNNEDSEITLFCEWLTSNKNIKILFKKLIKKSVEKQINEAKQNKSKK